MRSGYIGVEIGMVRAYAVGLSNVITLFSVDRVVIGGGVAKIGEALIEPIRQRVDESVFFPDKGRYDIRPAALMDDAVLVRSGHGGYGTYGSAGRMTGVRGIKKA
jgi:predicted NBD/HSP70 family sugar kinase